MAYRSRRKLAGNLLAAFSRVRQVIGRPLLTLGCDCMLRILDLPISSMTDKRGGGFHA